MRQDQTMMCRASALDSVHVTGSDAQAKAPLIMIDLERSCERCFVSRQGKGRTIRC